jgi:hypothetical protein
MIWQYNNKWQYYCTPGKSIWHDSLIKFGSVHLESEMMIATLQLAFLLNICIVE